MMELENVDLLLPLIVDPEVNTDSINGPGDRTISTDENDGEVITDEGCDRTQEVVSGDEEEVSPDEECDRVEGITDQERDDRSAGLVVYQVRWVILSLFMLASITSAILWITFAPIAPLVEEYYGVNSSHVNALSIVFMVAYLPVTVLSTFFLQNYGVDSNMIAACLLNCLSGLIRFLSARGNEEPRGEHAYLLLLIGQTFGAIAQPSITNLPARIGALWFPKEERDLAVAIASLANLVGIAIGNILPALFTKDDDQSVKMFDLLLIEFLLTVIVFVCVVCLFQGKPPTPPSVSECNRRRIEQNTAIQDLKLLFTNRDFNILVFTFGVIGLGMFNCFTTVTDELIQPVGYTTNEASMLMSLLISCGIFGAIGVGSALDRTHKYNEFLKGGFTAAGFFMILFVLLLRPNNITIVSVIFGFMGISMVPLLPITFECACECTYPIREDLSTGVLQSVGSLSGIFYILLVSYLLDKESEYDKNYILEPTYIIFIVSSALLIVSSQFYNGKHLRLEAETTL